MPNKHSEPKILLAAFVDNRGPALLLPEMIRFFTEAVSLIHIKSVLEQGLFIRRKGI